LKDQISCILYIKINLVGKGNIFGPRAEETGGWRKLHNEELHNLYSSPNIIRMIKSRRIKLAGHVARIGAKRIEYRVLVGKPEGQRPLGRPRRMWEDAS
jgi:hypothetical protein